MWYNYLNSPWTSANWAAVAKNYQATTSPAVTNQVAAVSTTPFIRENDVAFSAKNLKPALTANLFFDQIKVNNLSQRASVVNVTSSSVLANIKINEGIFATTSHAYAEILGTSRSDTQNLLYVNDNFVSLYLVKVNAGDADFADADFLVDDIVYQTINNSVFTYNSSTSIAGLSYYGTYDEPNYSFYGKVKKWYRISASAGVLVIEPLKGRANSSIESATSNYIFNAMSSVNRKADYFRANARFSAGETITYSGNGTNFAVVSPTNSYVGLSGIVPTINTAGNLRSVMISSNNFTRDGLSTIVGNTLYIVSGTNQGFSSQVVGTTTRNHYIELVLNDAMPQNLTSNSVYSISNHQVDDVGSLYGIFHIPSETNLKWPTGERVFTVTDTATYNDNNYQMRSIAKYTALGVTNSVENARNFVLVDQTPSSMVAPTAPWLPNRRVNDRKYMSQTFFTPKKSEIVNGEVKTSYGVFVSSIDLYFQAKPTTSGELLPFTIAITKVSNGIPTEEIIAERSLDQQDIVVSNSPSLSNTSTRTQFKFADPVYLLPETEYAIRLSSESPDYKVWTATVGETIVDDSGNTRRVSQQPYVGSFFTAQNASNWNPIENQDLMFNINRAVFSGTSEFYFNLNPSSLTLPVLADLVKVSVTEQQFTPTTAKYEFKSKLIDSSDVDFISLKNNEIYNFARDLNISSTTAKRRRLIRANQSNDVNVKVTLTTSDDSVTPVINKERAGLFAIQNIINNAGIANNLISIVDRGSGYNVSNGITVTIGAPDVGTNRAIANVLPAQITGNGFISGINVINPGSGYFTTPTITIATGALDTTNTGRGALARINGETDSLGGNHLAKYQTKIVTLMDGFDAGDLIVRLDAVRPQGTDIQVYFKVLSGQDSDSFVDKKWQRMNKVGDVFSPTIKDVVKMEYRYNLDNGQINYLDNGRSYPLGGKFKYFAIKIRLSAEDPSVTPSVDSLKVMAVPGG